jgi:hypothetical protein
VPVFVVRFISENNFGMQPNLPVPKFVLPYAHSSSIKMQLDSIGSTILKSGEQNIWTSRYKIAQKQIFGQSSRNHSACAYPEPQFLPQELKLVRVDLRRIQ